MENVIAEMEGRVLKVKQLGKSKTRTNLTSVGFSLIWMLSQGFVQRSSTLVLSVRVTSHSTGLSPRPVRNERSHVWGCGPCGFDLSPLFHWRPVMTEAEIFFFLGKTDTLSNNRFLERRPTAMSYFWHLSNSRRLYLEFDWRIGMLRKWTHKVRSFRSSTY